MNILPFFIHSFTSLHPVWVIMPVVGGMISYLYFRFYRKERQLLSIVQSALYGYIFFVLGATLLSRQPGVNESIHLDLFQDLKLMISFHASTLIEIIANFVLFVPFGVLVCYIWNRKKVDKPGWCICLTYAMLPGLLLSLFIESAQLIFSMGSFEIKDIVFNTMGYMFGWIIWKFGMMICYEISDILTRN